MKIDERFMASIRKISRIYPISGADAIQLARVDGWDVVIKKGEHQEGDVVVYCEIDSWIPHEIAPFLSKGQEPKEYNGVLGNRLKTVKLRGQISQGLILPITILPDQNVKVGSDVSGILGIQKWEAPIPTHLSGQIAGTFPTHLCPKTDQERVQNYRDIHSMIGSGCEFVIEEKLDGSSCTIIVHDGMMRVCSRNLELKRDNTNSFWVAASKFEKQILDYHEYTGRSLAIQGELIGPSIQGNPYKLSGVEIFVFDIYDIDNRHFLNVHERLEIVEELKMKSVPTLDFKFFDENSFDIDDVIKESDGVSALNPKSPREGVVYKCVDSPWFTFKAISNKWLIKTGK